MQLPNELLWVLFLLLDMLVVVGVYRFFGREGLMCYLVFALIACNIEVLKLVDMFGLTVTLGNVFYGSIFLTTDILAEMHGREAARKAIWLGFVTLLALTFFMQLSLAFVPSPFDAAHPHLAALFGFLPRIAIGSLTAYLISQHLDVTLYMWLLKVTGGRQLWLRNNGSTMLSQAVDTLLFTLLALAPLPILGTVPGFETWGVIWQAALATYLLKLFVSAADTPFIYLARHIGAKYHGINPANVPDPPAGVSASHSTGRI